tara:strand:+ start:1345 stop:1722 length:378 start_codon:yes stop_codon:yes gene_type:complete
MPCEQCEEGLYRWGETGECLYETLEDCQLDNQDAYLEGDLEPKSDLPIDFTMHFSRDQMHDLHENGEVLIEVEGSEEGEKMNILFTYDVEEEEVEEDEEEYNPDEEEIKDTFVQCFDKVIKNLKE